MTDYTAGPVTQVATVSKTTYNSDVKALVGGGYVVVYQESADFFNFPFYATIHIQVYNAAGEKVGTEAKIDFPNRDDKALDGALALADGSFLVTWTDGWGAAYSQQHYDATGTAIGSEVQLPHKIVGLSGSSYVGVRSVNIDNAHSELFYQVYDQDFQAAGPEIQIDDGGAFTRYPESFARLNDGGLVFIFNSIGQDGDGSGSYVQQFDSEGQKVGSEVQLDTAHTAGNQVDADIAALANGGYVVTWVNAESTSPYGAEVLAQRFDASGNKVGEEVHVPLGANNAFNPDVIGLSDGGYVIAWRGAGVDTSGIYTQRFDDTGAKAGPETFSSTTQAAGERLTELSDGSYVLEWAENDYLNGTSKVFQEIFSRVLSHSLELTGDQHDNTLDGTTELGMQMHGLAGNDTYIVDDADDRVFETADSLDTGGRDTVVASIGFTLGLNVENLTLSGAASIDGTGNLLANVITGNGAANHLIGFAGNDKLDGGVGADTMTGGIGADTYIVDEIGDVVIELAGHGTDTVKSSVRYTLGDNVERLTLTGTLNIAGTGNALDNILIGNEGNNRLDGGAGADTMAGGLGNDFYTIDNAGDVIREAVGQGIDGVIVGFSYALGGQYVENITLTGTTDINATGNALANTLIGNSGNNVLNGLSGIDKMFGGAGNDTYYIDNAGDRTYEVAHDLTDSGGHDVVYAGVQTTLEKFVEDLFITGTFNLGGTGNALDNHITGNSGNNVLAGRDGNDVLDGAAGGDRLIGGLGDDSYYIDNVGDRVIENIGQGNDTIYSSISFYLSRQYVETLVLTGTGDINATGNNTANNLIGNDGNNILEGGRGNDMLSGGKGADAFVFHFRSGADIINDFNSAEGDTIRLSGLPHGVTVTVDGTDILLDFSGGDMVRLVAPVNWNHDSIVWG